MRSINNVIYMKFSEHKVEAIKIWFISVLADYLTFI